MALLRSRGSSYAEYAGGEFYLCSKVEEAKNSLFPCFSFQFHPIISTEFSLFDNFFKASAQAVSRGPGIGAEINFGNYLLS
jgi:hypothetical protein